MHRFTGEQASWIRDHFQGRSYRELTMEFNAHFNACLAPAQIKSACRCRGIRKERTGHQFSEEQIAWLEVNIKGQGRWDLLRAFNAHFGLALSFCSIQCVCKRHGLKNGRNTLIAPGSNVCGGKRVIYQKSVGSEIWYRGKVKIKAADGTWKLKHVAIWEAARGPVPPGHFIIFADDNPVNFALDNLLLVTCGEMLHMRRKRLISEDADLTRSGLVLARVLSKTHQLGRAPKGR